MHEFMDKNRKEENLWHHLREVGSLWVDPSGIVLVSEGAEVA